MKIIRKIIEPTALIVLLVGGFGMLASTFLGTADVIGTQVFGQPVHGALELTESTMVVIVLGRLHMPKYAGTIFGWNYFTRVLDHGPKV